MLDFNTIKYFYKRGLWSAALVLTSVKKGIITKEEADMILNDNE